MLLLMGAGLGRGRACGLLRPARARRLASSSREPAAALAAPRASSPLSSNAVARGRDSLAPRAEPRADSYRARSLSSVSRAR
eukprot:scaffold133414_cov112-Phaeocystis_antarctica.AAC.1